MLCVYARVYNIMFAGINISFNQSVYIIGEDSKAVKPVLLLSKSSSTDILVNVRSYTAAGKYTNITFHKKLTVMILQEVLIMILDHSLSHFLLE